MRDTPTPALTLVPAASGAGRVAHRVADDVGGLSHPHRGTPLADAAGIILPPLVTVACPPCASRPSPASACTACLGRGRVHLLAELVAAGAGALARWERHRHQDAAAGRVAPGAVRLPSGEVAYGVAADVAAGTVALVDLPEHAERLAAEQRSAIAARSRRRERARVAIAAARRQLALVPPPPAATGLETAS